MCASNLFEFRQSGRTRNSAKGVCNGLLGVIGGYRE